MRAAQTSGLPGILSLFGSGRGSPPREIFEYAYRRIWAGNGLWIFETVLWCIAGAYLGFRLFDLPGYQLDMILERFCRYGLPALTPIIIGIAIFKAQVNIGTGDVSLRGVPLSGSQVLGPRFLAVFVTWIQIMTPMIVVLYAFNLGMLKELSSFLDNPLQIQSTRYLFVDWLSAGRNSDIPEFVTTGDLTPTVFLCFQAIGWGLLPISWGLMWATIYQRRGGPFILAYILYLLIPGIIFALINWYFYNLEFFNTYIFWTLVTTTVIGTLLLSWVFYGVTCRIWDRRSG